MAAATPGPAGGRVDVAIRFPQRRLVLRLTPEWDPSGAARLGSITPGRPARAQLRELPLPDTDRRTLALYHAAPGSASAQALRWQRCCCCGRGANRSAASPGRSGRQSRHPHSQPHAPPLSGSGEGPAPRGEQGRCDASVWTVEPDREGLGDRSCGPRVADSRAASGRAESPSCLRESPFGRSPRRRRSAFGGLDRGDRNVTPQQTKRSRC
jgi:hypothetical protein